MEKIAIPITAIGKAKQTRATLKGRQLIPAAQNDIAQLLSDRPRERQYLIEYLHLLQDTYGHLSAAHLTALAQALRLAQTEVYEVATFYHHFDVVKENETAPPALTIRVCQSIACEMTGSKALRAQLAEKFASSIGATVRVIEAPCVGQCDHAPMAVVNQTQIKNANVERIAQALEQPAINRPIAATPLPSNAFATLKNCAAGLCTFDDLFATLNEANLRGLGGAGFPAAKKWQIVRSFAAPRLMVVNADEGEPGTFKDRYYLENHPWQFIEGMLLAAWAVEASVIYIYLRDEYHDTRRQLTENLEYLRRNISQQLPATYALPKIELRRGAGAYICGEESALIESVEGKRGLPRLRPPYIAEVGVFGRPTLAHNVETLYWIPEILQNGAAWWNGAGRNARHGLRSFSVSGRVKNPGVKLAPAGITLRELIDEFCDGMQDGHTLYGYLPGGASGGMLPATLANLPLDFDTLQAYDCFIGSAAIVVFSEHDRARDVALNLMRFFEHESCGQCTPCRVGTRKAVLLMEQPQWDEKLLHALSQTMMDASICGLGQAAPNPLLCAMKYFPQEFEK